MGRLIDLNLERTRRALRAAAVALAGSQVLLVRYEGHGADYMRDFLAERNMLHESGSGVTAIVMDVKVASDGVVVLTGEDVVPFDADFYDRLVIKPKSGRMEVTYDGTKKTEILAKMASEVVVENRSVSIVEHGKAQKAKLKSGDNIFMAAV